MINDGDPWDKKTITERIEAGEAAIARARGEGRDVSAWEAHLTELKQLARLGVTVDDVLRIFPGGKIVYKVFDADNNVLDTISAARQKWFVRNGRWFVRRVMATGEDS